jgi:hypothetical protein
MNGKEITEEEKAQMIKIMEGEARARRDPDYQLIILRDQLLICWDDLFYNCYGAHYPPSGKEKGMLLNLCRDFTESDIKPAMVAIFCGFLSDDWHSERNIYPSLLKFIQKVDDDWKSQGLVLKRYMNLDSERWWIVNQAGVDVNQLDGFFLKVERECGECFVYSAANGVFFELPVEEWPETE